MPCVIPLILRAAIGGVVAVFSCKVLLTYGADVYPAAQGQHRDWYGTSHSSCYHHGSDVAPDQSCHCICPVVSSAKPLSLSEQAVWPAQHVANAHPWDRHACVLS
jgi:hypothetical protein